MAEAFSQMLHCLLGAQGEGCNLSMEDCRSNDGKENGDATRISEYNQKNTPSASITFRPIADEDHEFLYRLYASTRLSEMSATGWNDGQVEAFLRMQFGLQHTQYMNNKEAAFDLIISEDIPMGRLYVNRKEDRIHVIDIALLPEFRRMGIGGSILRNLAEEADERGLMMSLYVEMNNPILPFYRSIGLREIELRGIYYYMEREVNRFPAGLV